LTKYRIIEETPGRFVVQEAHWTGETEDSWGWHNVTQAKTSAGYAELAFNDYITDKKLRMDFEQKKKEGKHIIKEFEL
jgi:hypothetical protein